jgi:CNT family concentrative nucleoside transporter
VFTSLLTLTTTAHAAEFLPYETTIMDRCLSLAGIGAFILFAWLLSESRKDISWRPVLWGVGLQLVFGLIVLSPAVSEFVFYVINTGVDRLLGFAGNGGEFLFGSMQPHIVSMADGSSSVYAGKISPPLANFAFVVLPTIVFFSALMSVMYHIGIMQFIVKIIAKAMMKTLGTSGAETLSAAGNIFVGQTEAPLMIRPFIAGMTRSELMAVMTGGFATVAGGVLGAYALFLQGIPNIAGHLVVASIISAPAALAVAKLMIPETQVSPTAGDFTFTFEKNASNTIEAAAVGATDGMKLAINVAAMLIAIVALVAMFDWMIGFVPLSICDAGLTVGYSCGSGVATTPLSLSAILGWCFAPVAFLMGVPWSESAIIGQLLGEKIVLTEFIAYMNLSEIINAPVATISERSAIIASYALCGFANFASIGIQLGGIGGIAPERMSDLASIGMRAMIAGVIAACMTGAVAGLML